MRIVYGVFGYGRGHATRALAVLPELERHHELMVVASGDAYDLLAPLYEVHRVPALRFIYQKGRLSTLGTIAANRGALADVLLGGPALDELTRRLRAFGPDLAIADAEPFTHRAAMRLGLPRIAFDHYGILAWCSPPVPDGEQLRLRRDVLVYRTLMGTPERAIVSSFFRAPPLRSDVRQVPTLLREQVRRARSRRGEHLLVYLNQGAQLWSPALERGLRALAMPAIVYGTERVGVDGNLDFRAPSTSAFVDDLARAIAVVSTAGNQLVGEALHLRKPMLVMPEDSVEQAVNALAVERIGAGRRIAQRSPTIEELRAFVREARQLRAAMPLAFDGRAQALAALERFAAELVPAHRRRLFVEKRVA
jgi:uncharacterized protein (TIGR00661 family)